MANPDFIREGDALYAQISRAFRSEGTPRRHDWAGSVWERRKDNGSIFYANVSPSGNIDALYGGSSAYTTRPPEPTKPTSDEAPEPEVPLADISLYAPEGGLAPEPFSEPVLDLETEQDMPVEPGQSLGDAIEEGRAIETIDQGGPVTPARPARKAKPKA